MNQQEKTQRSALVAHWLDLGFEFSKNFVAGTVAGCSDTVFGYPLDTVKSRMQHQGSSKQFAGPIDCLKQSIKSDGVIGLYSGASSYILRSAIGGSILFGTMGFFKRELDVEMGTPSHPQRLVAAAAATGVVEAIVYCPLEVIKVRMQTAQCQVLKQSSWGCTKIIVNTQGVSGLYRGFSALLMREVIGNSIYFLSYEYTKSYIFRNFIYHSQQTQVKHRKGGLKWPELAAIAFSGGMSGALYWGITHPIDTVKTVMQADNSQNPRFKGMIDCTRHLVRDGNLKLLYKGITPSLIRSVPSSAVTFVVFEMVVNFINQLFE